ncbi:MAG TPA: 16S rRNA (uracil(1498)-N(3))-methyltransferase [Pyrinomonadaceae bacterium]|nr:16S rRNA (uracil(1498)-N(3))-methyltransferase [Pyrinomonadaceae bacterium]
MARRRFYAPPSAFNLKLSSVTLAEEEARHLRDVLRLKVGDEVSVFDGAGKEFQCRVIESRRNRAELELVGETEPLRPESPLQLTLAVALLKGEKFDLVVQKTTELGVSQIVPVVTKLADVRLRDNVDTTKRVTRWQRIALEAAKQSGRAFVPTIAAPVDFAELVQESSTAVRIMFTERDGQSWNQTQSSLEKVEALTALIGSEGGWTNDELSLAQEAGWKLVTLGGRTLRAETAAIAVATLLQHLYGDLH